MAPDGPSVAEALVPRTLLSASSDMPAGATASHGRPFAALRPQQISRMGNPIVNLALILAGRDQTARALSPEPCDWRLATGDWRLNAATAMASRFTPDPRVADLVRAGTLRLALFLPQHTNEPTTGETKYEATRICCASPIIVSRTTTTTATSSLQVWLRKRNLQDVHRETTMVRRHKGRRKRRA